MGKFPFKRPRIISKKFPELDSSIDGVTKSLNDLVFSYNEQVKQALSKKHWLMAFSSMVLLLVLGSFISMRGKADSSVFYPESCLGGWISPQHAQGELQTTSNNDESQFTKDNSAILPKNTNGEIYCGNFKGTFDATTKPKKITVSLALTKGSDLTPEELLQGGIHVASSTIIPVDDATSSTPNVLMQASSTDLASSTSFEKEDDNLMPNQEEQTSQVSSSSNSGSSETSFATPGSSKNNNPTIVEGILKSVQDTIHIFVKTVDKGKDETDTVIIRTPSVQQENQDQQKSTTTEIKIETLPTSKPADTSSSSSSTPSTSFLLEIKNAIFSYIDLFFVDKVFAQDVSQESRENGIPNEPAIPVLEEKNNQVPQENMSEKISTTTDSEIKTEIKSDETNPSFDVLNLKDTISTSSTHGVNNFTTVTIGSTTSNSTTSSELASTSEDVALSTETSLIKEEDTISQNNFLEVLYSFDGVTWVSLGLLNEISMKYRTFEIPVTSTTSWSKIDQLQIKVEAKKNKVESPTIYLDGIKVEVLFETIVPHDHPDFSRDTVLVDKSNGDNIRIINIINSDTNATEIWYTTINSQESYGIAPGSWIKVNLEDPAISYDLIDIVGDIIFWIDKSKQVLWVTNIQKETNDGIGLQEGATTTVEALGNEEENYILEYYKDKQTHVIYKKI